MSWADDTFGGRNPKVGVNHVHWVLLCVPWMSIFACIIACALMCLEYTIFLQYV